MTEHDIDSASDSGVSGDWEQLGGGRGHKNGGGQHGGSTDDGQSGKKSGSGKSGSPSISIELTQ